MKVLILGSNPSEASPDISAFHPNTRSRIILDGWFGDLDIDAHYANICDQSTPKNRPLRVSEIRDCLPDLRQKLEGFGKIVALGKTSSKALKMLDIEHFACPHPSGMNQPIKLPRIVAKTVEALHEYCRQDQREARES